MRLAEMTDRPRRAGVAAVVFNSRLLRPRLWGSGTIIGLPDYPDHELISVLGGRSLVFRLAGTDQTYFMGYDDNSVFCSRFVDPRHFTTLVEQGEAAFLDSLVPEIVHRFTTE